jgi:two-component system phosphate regulon sensor histidine kinase PhoR
LGVFVVLAAVLVALVGWWVIFQVRTELAQRQETEERLRNAARVARTLLNENSEPVDPDEFLDGYFPGLVYEPTSGQRGLRDTSAMPVVADEICVDTTVILAMDVRSRRLVRMFLAEGAVFMSLQLIGVAIVFGALRREVRLKRQQENFLSATTHELKSPLTSIGLFSETLKHPELTSERRSEIVDKIRQDVKRLEGLINNMFDASRADEGRFKPDLERIDLGTYSLDLVQRMRGELDASQIQLNVEAEPNTLVAADRRYLETIFRNLIQNATKYGGRGTRVDVRAHADENHGVLVVSDDGPGLSRADQKRIFDRFYRVGDEMVRRVPVSGLGLYLSREMARALGGTIHAHSDGLGQGTTFRVSLPLGGD